jgi:hypothetical protein
MRNLGRQPLATANLTVVTTANVSMKAHSAVQAWALLLKDALEQAWQITCKWLNQDKHAGGQRAHRFRRGFRGRDRTGFAAEGAAAGVISKRLQFNEMKRRGVLSDDADWDEDQQQSAEEQQGEQLQPEKMIDPVTGPARGGDAAAWGDQPAAAVFRNRGLHSASGLAGTRERPRRLRWRARRRRHLTRRSRSRAGAGNPEARGSTPADRIPPQRGRQARSCGT